MNAGQGWDGEGYPIHMMRASAVEAFAALDVAGRSLAALHFELMADTTMAFMAVEKDPNSPKWIEQKRMVDLAFDEVLEIMDKTHPKARAYVKKFHAIPTGRIDKLAVENPEFRDVIKATGRKLKAKRKAARRARKASR